MHLLVNINILTFDIFSIHFKEEIFLKVMIITACANCYRREVVVVRKRNLLLNRADLGSNSASDS